jgi:hypothetical protein
MGDIRRINNLLPCTNIWHAQNVYVLWIHLCGATMACMAAISPNRRALPHREARCKHATIAEISDGKILLAYCWVMAYARDTYQQLK